MPDRPRLVVRALILDEADRVLLVRFEFTDVTLWATPGGGVDFGEDEETALRRELAEETGLRGFGMGPLIWIREHEFKLNGRDYWQYERIYLVRTDSFEPAPEWSWDELNTEGMTDIGGGPSTRCWKPTPCSAPPACPSSWRAS